MNASVRTVSSKVDSNTWESFPRSGLKLESVKSHHAQTSSGKGLPSYFLKQNHHHKHLTWAKEKTNGTVAQSSKVLFSDKSTFCINLEINVRSMEEDFRGTEKAA